MVSIEVLEHIDDDVGALATMVGLSRRFVWVLVPFCDERQFHDPAARSAALARHEHVLPGYPHELLAERMAGLDTRWQRNCYFQPEADVLRARMADATVSRLVLDREQLFAAAVRDIRARRVVDGRDAQGVEVLAEVRPSS